MIVCNTEFEAAVFAVLHSNLGHDLYHTLLNIVSFRTITVSLLNEFIFPRFQPLRSGRRLIIKKGGIITAQLNIRSGPFFHPGAAKHQAGSCIINIPYRSADIIPFIGKRKRVFQFKYLLMPSRTEAQRPAIVGATFFPTKVRFQSP